MTETPITEAPAPTPKFEPKSTAHTPAIARCIKAWNRAYKETPKTDDDDYDADENANEAYRTAMPNLVGIENIRDFIACVTHGMLIDAISYNDATKLLYAAQVAMTSADRPSKSKKPAL